MYSSDQQMKELLSVDFFTIWYNWTLLHYTRKLNTTWWFINASKTTQCCLASCEVFIIKSTELFSKSLKGISQNYNYVEAISQIILWFLSSLWLGFFFWGGGALTFIKFFDDNCLHIWLKFRINVIWLYIL